MNVGRVALAVTLLVSFPLLVVPLTGTLVRAHREMAGEPFEVMPAPVALRFISSFLLIIVDTISCFRCKPLLASKGEVMSDLACCARFSTVAGLLWAMTVFNRYETFALLSNLRFVVVGTASMDV